MIANVKEKNPSFNLGAYIQLTKPSIIYLLVLTAATAMFLVDGFETNILMALTGIFGIGLIAASSAAINQILDLEIDAKMKRTDKRPLVAGKIPVINAITFAAILFIIGSFLLLTFNNFLSWALTVATWIFYAFLYTRILKFAGPQNIVIGGLAGAMPPVLGWVALTGSISPLPLLLVAIIFVWTPPHFWALAIYRRDDYARESIPMLPVTHGVKFTKLQIILYTILLFIVSLLPYVVLMSGVIYLIASLVLGIIYLYTSFKMYFYDDNDYPMVSFQYSVYYIFLIFAALLLDHFLVQ